MVQTSAPQAVESEYLSPEQVCEKYPGLKPHTLAMWRYRGRGPAWKKLGRIVIYPRDELAEWVEAAPGRPNASS